MRWTPAQQAEAVRKRHGAGAGLLGFRGEAKADTGSGRRDLVVIASTADVDLENEVVLPGGLDRSHFEKNGTIFLDHRYEAEYAVAKLDTISPIKSEGGEVKAWKVRMRMSDNALADDLIKMTRGGHAPGSSIGFAPIDRGAPTEDEIVKYGKGQRFESIVRSASWLELSLTFMPCNVACQAVGSGSVDESKLAALDGLVTKGLIRRETALAFGLRDARRRAIILL